MNNLKDDHHLIVCVSGGKDSTALALWLRFDSGLKNPMTFVHNDTGHEHPFTLLHLDNLESALGQEIVVIKGQWSFIELAEEKQRFPGSRSRFCTEELKVKPLKEWLAEQEGNGAIDNPVVCQGVRWEESLRRSSLPEWQNEDDPKFRSAYDAPIWRPIIRWTHQDVFDQHKKHNIEPNGLYKLGLSRVGCWPCIMASKADLKFAFEADPDLLDRLRRYEARVAKKAARGMASLFPPNKVPEKFHDKSYINKDGERITYPSIDAVYRWAIDPSQQELNFGPPPSCFSQYGLCE